MAGCGSPCSPSISASSSTTRWKRSVTRPRRRAFGSTRCWRRRACWSAATRAGGEVIECRTPDEALREVAQRRPDVLVSDIEMPGQDGYSLIRKVRSLDPEHGGKMPAVALTAFGRPEDRIRSLKAGFNIHLT